jgi:hypothetical protein
MADESILAETPEQTVDESAGARILATVPVSPKLCAWMASGALLIAFLTSLICIGTWISLFVNPTGKSAGEPPVWTGDKNDAQKQYSYITIESHVQRARAEQRTTISQGCMQLAGVALIFLALGLFLIAVARVKTVPGKAPVSFKEWEISVAGIAALVCAALMFIYSVPQGGSKPPEAAFPSVVPVFTQPVLGVS